MRCLRRLVVIVLLSLSPAFAAESFFGDLRFDQDLNVGATRERLFLPRIESRPITIDGRADEPAWNDALRFGDFQQSESGLPIPEEIDTTGRIIRAADGLYVAIIGKRAPLPPPYQGRDGKADPANPAFASQGLDTIALQFNPNVNNFTRYRFGITGEGTTFALRHFLVPAWNPEGWSAAYHADNATITAEFFIPWKLLDAQPPVDGDRMAFNVIRYASTIVPVPGGPFRYPIGDEYQFRSALCHSVEPIDHFPWLCFSDPAAQKAEAPIARLYLDKSVYRLGDECADAYLELRPPVGCSLQIALLDGSGAALHERKYDQLATPEIGFSFHQTALKAGEYTLRATATRDGKAVAVAERPFRVEATDDKPMKLPEAVELILTDNADIGTGIRPISTGIPLPRGTVFDKDLAHITVERRVPTGKDATQPWLSEWKPIDTQLEIRNRWYRDGSIRWLGVDFQADYFRGRQQAVLMPDHPYYPTYRVNFAVPPPQVEKPLRVSETDEAITVDTGAIKAVVSKKRFQLVSEAWLGGAKLIDAGAGDGLVHVDERGREFTAAHDATRVWVERTGPMTVVVCAEGWYQNGGEREGRHLTRMFFHRGEAEVRVHHTYIITVDTRQHTIRNIAVKLGVPDIRQYTLEGVSGEGEGYLLQQRHNQYVIERDGKALGRGDRASGSLLVTTQRGLVQLAARRFWQLYPKELEVTKRGIALHVWPAHGRKVFSDEEIASPLGVAQALFAHHGQKLNLRVPDVCYETMGAAFSKHLVDRGYDKPIAPNIAGFQFVYAYDAWQANAQGMAFTTEFAIRLAAGPSPEDGSFARAFSADAHAIADPKWTYQTRVFGELWPRDVAHFGAVERYIDQRHQEVMVDETDRLGDYGMVNWPDFHTYPVSQYTGRPEASWFHRTWTSTHYQEGRTFYLLYLRSGEDRYWQYARDSTRHKMDVNTVNYASLPRVGPNQTPWGGYHVYGMYGWAGSQGISCHWQNLDYKMWDYFLTGDIRGREQATNWAREMARSTWATEATRDAAVTLGEAMEVYQATRYAPLLKTIHWFKEAVVAVPIADYILPHYSQMVWSRAHEYTRDPRIAQRLIEQWGDGAAAMPNGLGGANTILTTYRLTGDKRLLALLSFAPPKPNPMIPGMGPPSISQTMMSYPYAMAGLAEVNAGGDVLIDPMAHRLFWKPWMDKWRTDGKKLWGQEIKP